MLASMSDGNEKAKIGFEATSKLKTSRRGFVLILFRTIFGTSRGRQCCLKRYPESALSLSFTANNGSAEVDIQTKARLCHD